MIVIIIINTLGVTPYIAYATAPWQVYSIGGEVCVFHIVTTTKNVKTNKNK